MSDSKPSKRTPSWFVIKTSMRIGDKWTDVYLGHGGLIRGLSGATRFSAFTTAAQQLHRFQESSNEGDGVKWSARVVGLLTKSGQP